MSNISIVDWDQPSKQRLLKASGDLIVAFAAAWLEDKRIKPYSFCIWLHHMLDARLAVMRGHR